MCTRAGPMTAQRTRLGVQDELWLVMDRPNNLMVVDSVIWTAEPLDRELTRDVLVERLWDRYPVFRSRAVQDPDGTWWWEEDPEARFEDLVTYVELDDPDDPRSLQELVAAHRTQPLDRDRPLWNVLWVDRYLGGSALVTRSHHAIADGIRMVQLSMSLFDATPEGGAILAPPVHQYGARVAEPAPSASERSRAALGALGSQAAGTARATRAAGGELVSLGWRIPRAVVDASREAAIEALVNPLGAVHGGSRRPGRLRPRPSPKRVRLWEPQCRAAVRSWRCSPAPRVTSTSSASSCSAPATTRPYGPGRPPRTRRLPGRNHSPSIRSSRSPTPRVPPSTTCWSPVWPVRYGGTWRAATATAHR
ncbi:MAG: hypothetical protein M5U19_18640 [Microthrixaceae bacterium]|nr:hypothetical protein [Microthrixaceae bacterium]